MNEEKEILGLPVEYCPICKQDRIMSKERSFCLTCGFVVEEKRPDNVLQKEEERMREGGR
jgi:transcription initiation factor TFIIIB Brf1 subunit/transcription initiation factor TFIIB